MSGRRVLRFVLALAPLLVGCGKSSKEDDTSSAGSDSGANGGTANGGTANGGAANGGSANGGSTNGGTANGGSANGGAGGSEDIDPCDGFPRAGQACAPNGTACQVPGSPCGSIFTCHDGSWTEEVVCPPTPMCPSSRPELGTACEGITPVAGLTCVYEDGCGRVTATCEDSSWQLAPEPTEECGALCEDFCTRISGCGIDWADECVPRCALEYLCPGESPGHDAAICEAQRAALSDDCGALCTSAAFAPSCP